MRIYLNLRFLSSKWLSFSFVLLFKTLRFLYTGTSLCFKDQLRQSKSHPLRKRGKNNKGVSSSVDTDFSRWHSEWLCVLVVQFHKSVTSWRGANTRLSATLHYLHWLKVQNKLTLTGRGIVEAF